MKKLIKAMGANKSDKAICRASKASGGVSKIVEGFEHQVSMRPKSALHTHKSSISDEKIISLDLRDIQPFKKETGRVFESFGNIPHDPISSLGKVKFAQWIDRHKKNILMHYPVSNDPKESDELSD